MTGVEEHNERTALMLSIGEFSRICKVSTKTLRYYAETGLFLPKEINKENGYRYYAVEQLETMLFINRLKSYHFSLEEIKSLMDCDEDKEEALFFALVKKKQEMKKQLNAFEKNLNQLNKDIFNLEHGKSIMTYLENIDIQLVEVPRLYLLSIRKLVQEQIFSSEYTYCFGKLFEKIQNEHFTVAAPPMVLFHSNEFTPFGLDTEFAIPVKEYAKGTRDFKAGLCIKTVVNGNYSELSSVYAKQINWAEQEGYECTNALFEVYVTNPNSVSNENELITEVYYPVKKKV